MAAVLRQVDNDDYVRRVLKTDDTKPASKSEPQRESSSRSKVCQLLLLSFTGNLAGNSAAAYRIIVIIIIIV